jgi:hypothetical protein
VAKLGDFEPLIRKLANKRTYRFPKTKAIVMTVADQKGADQLAPWIQRVYDRFQNQSTFSNRRITEPSAETGSIMRFLAGRW